MHVHKCFHIDLFVHIQSLSEQEEALKAQRKEQQEAVKAAAPDEKELKKMEKTVENFRKGKGMLKSCSLLFTLRTVFQKIF